MLWTCFLGFHAGANLRTLYCFLGRRSAEQYSVRRCPEGHRAIYSPQALLFATRDNQNYKQIRYITSNPESSRVINWLRTFSLPNRKKKKMFPRTSNTGHDFDCLPQENHCFSYQTVPTVSSYRHTSLTTRDTASTRLQERLRGMVPLGTMPGATNCYSGTELER